jgi:hypothetical protein
MRIARFDIFEIFDFLDWHFSRRGASSPPFSSTVVSVAVSSVLVVSVVVPVTAVSVRDVSVVVVPDGDSTLVAAGGSMGLGSTAGERPDDLVTGIFYTIILQILILHDESRLERTRNVREHTIQNIAIAGLAVKNRSGQVTENKTRLLSSIFCRELRGESFCCRRGRLLNAPFASS